MHVWVIDTQKRSRVHQHVHYEAQLCSIMGVHCSYFFDILKFRETKHDIVVQYYWQIIQCHAYQKHKPYTQLHVVYQTDINVAVQKRKQQDFQGILYSKQIIS